MPRISDIINEIEQFAPLSLQESYDNAGLQIGNPDAEAEAALLCLDVTEAIIDEAASRGCNLVVTHHPLLFRGIKRIGINSERERIIIKAIEYGITIYSAHTNLDNASRGVSHEIASRLGLSDIKVMVPQQGRLLKLVVFTPKNYARRLSAALFAAGAGAFRNYDSCSFESEGNGSFRPCEGANPFIGELGEIHIEPEIRQEFLISNDIKSRVVAALIATHPYEEPAFDLIPLDNASLDTGTGVVGNISPMPVAEFLDMLKKQMNVSSLRYSQGRSSTVSRVAICSGSGAEFIGNAIRSRADVYITGDVKYHDFTEKGSDIIIADIGHFESELCTKEIFYRIITEKFPNFATYYSENEKNPINYL